jgi:hypothetical protein
MVIGLKYGKRDPGDNAATEKTRAMVQNLLVEFTQCHGSINCTELLGYDISNRGEYKKARTDGLFFTKCPVLVRDTADIFEQLLWYRKQVKPGKGDGSGSERLKKQQLNRIIPVKGK